MNKDCDNSWGEMASMPCARLFVRRFVLALALAIGLLAGCDTTPTGPSGDMTDKTAEPIEPDEPVERVDESVRDINPWLGVDLFVLPIEQSLESAWAALEDRHIDAQAVQTWRANGFDVALADEAEVRAFLGQLPQTTHHRSQVQKLTEQWARLISSPAIGRRLPVVWHPPSREETHLQISGGRLQLLVRLENEQANEVEGGGADDASGIEASKLVIVAHHHFVRPSVLVRDAREIALAGRIFDELALTIAFPDEARWLIVGLTPSAHPPPPEDEATEEKEEAREAPPIQPYLLGWPILTGEQFGKPRQVLVIAAINRWQGGEGQ